MRTVLARRIKVSRRGSHHHKNQTTLDPIVAIITDGRSLLLTRGSSGATSEGESIIKQWPEGRRQITTSRRATSITTKDSREGDQRQHADCLLQPGFGAQSQINRGFNSRAAFTKLLTDGQASRALRSHGLTMPTRDAEKGHLWDMHSGKLKVLIGSRQEDGTRVNVREPADCPAYQDLRGSPADVEQPHGRIIRQGKPEFGSVDRLVIFTKGTYQSTMW